MFWYLGFSAGDSGFRAWDFGFRVLVRPESPSADPGAHTIHMSSVLWLNLVRLHSVYKVLYPKRRI